jgi:hypothetical protein
MMRDDLSRLRAGGSRAEQSCCLLPFGYKLDPIFVQCEFFLFGFKSHLHLEAKPFVTLLLVFFFDIKQLAHPSER